MSGRPRRSASSDGGLDAPPAYIILSDREGSRKMGSREEVRIVKVNHSKRNELRRQSSGESAPSQAREMEEKTRRSKEGGHVRDFPSSRRGDEPQPLEERRSRENGEVRRSREGKESRRTKDRSSSKRDKEKRRSYPGEEKSGSRRTRTPRRSRKLSPVRPSSTIPWDNNDNIIYITDDPPPVSITRGDGWQSRGRAGREGTQILPRQVVFFVI